MTDQQKVREAFPRYAAYRHLRAYGAWPSGVPDWAKNHEGSMDDVTLRNAVIDELAQAALSHASSATVKEHLTVGGSLAEWLEREMPAGTVIGDPQWWAKRIAGRVHLLYTRTAPSAEDARDAERFAHIAETAYALRDKVHGRSNAFVWSDDYPVAGAGRLENLRIKVDQAIDQALAAERGEDNG